MDGYCGFVIITFAVSRSLDIILIKLITFVAGSISLDVMWNDRSLFVHTKYYKPMNWHNLSLKWIYELPVIYSTLVVDVLSLFVYSTLVVDVLSLFVCLFSVGTRGYIYENVWARWHLYHIYSVVRQTSHTIWSDFISILLHTARNGSSSRYQKHSIRCSLR